MIDMMQWFVRDFCQPLPSKTVPGELCYKVTEFSWHLLDDLCQTIVFCDNGQHRLETWYQESRPGFKLVLRKDTSLRALQFLLIEHAKKESLRWMQSEDIIEKYRYTIAQYENALKHSPPKDINLLNAQAGIRLANNAPKTMEDFSAKREIYFLLGDAQRDLKKYMATLESLLFG